MEWRGTFSYVTVRSSARAFPLRIHYGRQPIASEPKADEIPLRREAATTFDGAGSVTIPKLVVGYGIWRCGGVPMVSVKLRELRVVGKGSCS